MDTDRKALEGAEYERADSKGEAEVRLLKLEAEFYRTCNDVRQNGVELHQVKSYLLKELLDLEIKKRKRLQERAVGAIYELQALREEQNLEVCQLKRQLQSYKLSHQSNARTSGETSANTPTQDTYPQDSRISSFTAANTNTVNTNNIANTNYVKSTDASSMCNHQDESVSVLPVTMKRKRGRPRKYNLATSQTQTASNTSSTDILNHLKEGVIQQGLVDSEKNAPLPNASTDTNIRSPDQWMPEGSQSQAIVVTLAPVKNLPSQTGRKIKFPKRRTRAPDLAVNSESALALPTLSDCPEEHYQEGVADGEHHQEEGETELKTDVLTESISSTSTTCLQNRNFVNKGQSSDETVEQKKRGRPKKFQRTNEGIGSGGVNNSPATSETQTEKDTLSSTDIISNHLKEGVIHQGLVDPEKDAPPPNVSTDTNIRSPDQGSQSQVVTVVKRKRGRPRKNRHTSKNVGSGGADNTPHTGHKLKLTSMDTSEDILNREIDMKVEHDNDSLDSEHKHPKVNTLQPKGNHEISKPKVKDDPLRKQKQSGSTENGSNVVISQEGDKAGQAEQAESDVVRSVCDMSFISTRTRSTKSTSEDSGFHQTEHPKMSKASYKKTKSLTSASDQEATSVAPYASDRDPSPEIPLQNSSTDSFMKSPRTTPMLLSPFDGDASKLVTDSDALQLKSGDMLGITPSVGYENLSLGVGSVDDSSAEDIEGGHLSDPLPSRRASFMNISGNDSSLVPFRSSIDLVDKYREASCPWIANSSDSETCKGMESESLPNGLGNPDSQTTMVSEVLENGVTSDYQKDNSTSVESQVRTEFKPTAKTRKSRLKTEGEHSSHLNPARQYNDSALSSDSLNGPTANVSKAQSPTSNSTKSFNFTSYTSTNGSQLPPAKKARTLIGHKSRDNSTIFQLSIVDDKEIPKRKTAIRVNTRGIGTLKLKPRVK